MKLFKLFKVFLSALILVGFATSAGAFSFQTTVEIYDIVKVACLTSNGNVLGRDSTDLKFEFPGGCEGGNQIDGGSPCNICLHALIRKGWAFDNTVIPGTVYFHAGPQDGEGAMLYQLYKTNTIKVDRY